MKCDNCGKLFPSTIRIDGKVRNLSSRLYCLDCSPFRSHNTKRIHDDDSQNAKVFSKTKEYHRLKRERLKMKAVQYKGGACSICGYDRCLWALEFHHLNPDEKEYPLTKMQSMSWDKIKTELDKCILVCANCHREIESQK